MKNWILVTIFMILPIFSHSSEVTAEESIPVNISQPKAAASSEAATNRIFILLGLLVVISGVAYFIAKKYGKPGQSAQTQIKVLTQHYLGPKKSLAIVRVAGESILIGVTDQSINLIKSLSLLDDEIPEQSPMNFEKTLQESEKVQSSNNEEFSIRHIRDVVSLKLKGMGKDL